jgi:DNA ligase (NAD+)
MIIPQIAENLTRSGSLAIPAACPVCGGQTTIRKENDAETLYCTNPDCAAKKIKAFTLFVSRDALGIDGLSEATLEKFISRGFLHRFGDIYELGAHREAMIEMEGFGEKSFDNLMESIERSKKTSLAKVLYGLGIANIGLSNARLICRHFDDDLEAILAAPREEIASISGIGPVIAKSLSDYFEKKENREQLMELLAHLDIEKEERPAAQPFDGKIFVITGSVAHFANRSEAKAYIESLGGKVTGSVTSKTSYLVNNDTTSNSSKNKKAKELGIPILSEEDLLALAESPELS